jgi:hypothetical protein
MADVNRMLGREIGLCGAIVCINSDAKQIIRSQRYSHQASLIRTAQVIRLGLVNVYKTKSGCLSKCGRCFENKDGCFACSMRRTSQDSNAFILASEG